MNDRQRLGTAFAQLQAAGIFAQGNLACCNTCALAEIPDDMDFVFWHGQDDEHFDADGNLTRTLHLGWGGDIEAIMRILKTELAERVSHDGDANHKIEVTPHAP